MKVDSIEGRSININVSTENSKPKVREAHHEIDKKEINTTDKNHMSISEKVVIEAIEKANKAIEGAKKEFRFSIHEETHEIMVKVLDKEKGEVIREIPPEKILDLVAKMWDMAGIIVDERR